MFRIKICGITNVEDAVAAVDAGADAIGLNFYEKSPRCVSPSTAKRIVEAHNGHVRVEANEPKGTVFVVTIPTSEKPRTPSGAFPR